MGSTSSSNNAVFFIFIFIFIVISPFAVVSVSDKLTMEDLLSAVTPTPSGWSSATHFCDWRGVECDTKNRVIVLDISYQSLSGTLPASLNSLTRLTVLSLQNNRFSGPLPTFSNLFRLRKLHLDDNSFNSLTKGAFSGLISLQILSLSNNTNLSPWPFPSELSNSIEMVALQASNANMVGSIPDIFMSFSRLLNLTLSYNNLTGLLPGSFNGSAIQELKLDNQKIGLTGNIHLLTGMNHLSVVWLNGNKFSGMVPPSLVSLPNLTDVRLDRNNFIGLIPPITHLSKNVSLTRNDYAGSSFRCRRCTVYIRATVGNVSVAPPPVGSSSGTKKNVGEVVGLTFLLVFVILVFFVWIYWKRRHPPPRPQPRQQPLPLPTRPQQQPLQAQPPPPPPPRQQPQPPPRRQQQEPPPWLQPQQPPPPPPRQQPQPPPRRQQQEPPPWLQPQPPPPPPPPRQQPQPPPRRQQQEPPPWLQPQPPPPPPPRQQPQPPPRRQQQEPPPWLQPPPPPSRPQPPPSRPRQPPPPPRPSPPPRPPRPQPSPPPPPPRPQPRPPPPRPSPQPPPPPRSRPQPRQQPTPPSSPPPPPPPPERTSTRRHWRQPKKYSYEFLRRVTNNFDMRNIIGEGTFGIVYKGTRSDGTTMIAVKRLKLRGGIEDFSNEIEALGWTRHPNLVKLLGYFAEDEVRILVYEYMVNGSLEKWIYHTDPRRSLTWPEMKNIIQGIAQGIVHLHVECGMKILHRDLKPSNVVLDENKNAKLCDFGLAKLLDKDQNSTSTGYAGTRAYMAPEVEKEKRISDKVDVYSFGILVLEVLFGKRYCYLVLPGHKRVEERQLTHLMNKNLSVEMRKNTYEIERIGKLAVLCIHEKPEDRPRMSTVLGAIHILNAKLHEPEASSN